MKYLWKSGPGGIHRMRASANDEAVERGGEIELTDTQYAGYTTRGFVFEPADRRRKPPPVEEVIEEDASEE